MRNLIDKLLQLPIWAGPAITILFTVIYQIGLLQGWYELSLIWIVFFMVVGVLVSGWTGAILIMLWCFIYTSYLNVSLSRQVQAILGMGSIALLIQFFVTYLRVTISEREQHKYQAEINQAKANALDELNSNLNRLRSIEKKASDLDIFWNNKGELTRHDEVREIHHGLAHLVTLTNGWHLLYQEIAEISQNAQVESDEPYYPR